LKLKGYGLDLRGKLFVGNEKVEFSDGLKRIFNVNKYDIERIENLALVSRR
jgi:hypothetical protein